MFMGSLRTAASWALPAVVGAGFLAVFLYEFAPVMQRRPLVVDLQFPSGQGAETEVPVDRSLVLLLSLDGLPVLPAYTVDVTDASGVEAVQESVGAHASKATVKVPSLPAGRYFVKVTKPSGELLREFGFRVMK
jgi:uncharacterized membrane protein